MTVEVTKLTAYGLTGAQSGVTISKLMAYVLLDPGTEAGATPPVYHSYTYGQILKKPAS